MPEYKNAQSQKRQPLFSWGQYAMRVTAFWGYYFFYYSNYTVGILKKDDDPTEDIQCYLT